MNLRLSALACTVLLLAACGRHGVDDHDHGHDDHQGDDHEEQKGPNGGKVLREGDVELELAIFERGTPPEYRAWITRGGKPVDNARLTVKLTRLGGRQEVFSFGKQDDHWSGDGVVAEPHSFDVSASLRLDGEAHQWQWESHEGRVVIAAEMAAKAGIATAVAGPARIERTLPVYGRLVTPPDQQALVRARFPGIVTAVHANVGDRIAKGAVLAVIESNQSLQRYELRAPIAGVVQARLVNAGEKTTDAPLFTVAGDQMLWAELKVFPGQRAQVRPGQPVHVRHNDHVHESRIAHVTSAAGGAPFVLARVVLDNQDGEMAPGDLVKGQIVVERVDVPLAVDNRALQGFRDWTVAFINVDETYEARPLVLGRRDGRHAEVLEGLAAGDRYVVENSYLIKADIEKSGASHDH